VSLPPGLRGHGIRPLNEAMAIKRIDESQRSKLNVYRESHRVWQSLVKS